MNIVQYMDMDKKERAKKLQVGSNGVAFTPLPVIEIHFILNFNDDVG